MSETTHPARDDQDTLQPRDFIRAIVARDLEQSTHGGRVVTRFPPEPNGYLHIGHAKSICLNFGLAGEVPGAHCNLRFDDTNPETERPEYVESIQDSVRWLGFDWGDHLYFASDYFEQMYDVAEHLIRAGKAYVDSQTEEEIRTNRGTISGAGTDSPYRDRSVDENLDLFRRMRAGEFADGAHVLRARIDMASPNMLLRDPVLYRIRHATHYRTGDEWCIYPLYDFAHPLEDAIECVTHSLCTLEFETNRPLYDWVVDHAGLECRPRQYEFARLNLDYTVMSKRKLLMLVNGGHVGGWDDPRLPTLAGLRRRGVPPAAIRAFCDMIGVAKTDSRVDMGKLEYAIRDELNRTVRRVLCVLRPLKVVITNYPEEQVEELDAPYYPHDVPLHGSRLLPFSREIYIERDDFMEAPPRGFHRLAPGREVRLRYAYFITCEEVVKDAAGRVTELRCRYDPATRGGAAPDGRTVRGTLHWVSAAQAVPCEVRLYDRLFRVPDPDSSAAEEGVDFTELLNPKSLIVLPDARIEPSVAGDPAPTHYQFERQGYFVSDRVDSRAGKLVFNRTVTLRDTWAKLQVQAQAAKSTIVAAPPAVEQTPVLPGHVGAAPERTAPPRSATLAARRLRFETKLGLSTDDAEILTRDDASADLLEAATAGGAAPTAVANWIINELPRALGQATGSLPFPPEHLGELVRLVESGALSSTAGREVLAEMARTGAGPQELMEQLELTQVSDAAALGPVVDAILAAEPDKVAAYRGGRTGLIGFFVGQVMRETNGRANPELTRQLLEAKLG